jgi:hypothetical protein
MTRQATAVLALLAALGLSACEQGHEMAANTGLCPDFKAANKVAPLAAADPGAAPVDECVRRWAYSLASAHDPAGTVAEATVAACTPQLTRWNQAALGQPGADLEANSLTTGQPTTPLAEHASYVNARALFYVVQARAGRCAAPPTANGAPEGIS